MRVSDYLSVDASPPYTKSNPLHGWIFFACTRVFIGVSEDSCGLRGFSGRSEIRHFRSLRANSLRYRENTGHTKVRKVAWIADFGEKSAIDSLVP